ncbi:TPA: hypothetical protein ACOQZT_000808 [Serratia odorifera]
MIKKPALYLALFLLLCFIYLQITAGIIASSDGASGLLEGRDLAAGNILLSGWSLSTVSFYFTDLIWYAAATLLAGYGAWQSALLPSMMLALLSVFSLYLSVKDGKKKLWPIVIGFAAPGAFAALNTLMPVIHIGTYIYILGCFMLADRYANRGGVSCLIALGLLLAITLFSDNISSYLAVVPLCLSYGYAAYQQKSAKHAGVVVMVILSSLLAKLIAAGFDALGGFYLPGIPSPTFVNFDDIGNNLYLFTKGLILYFNADIFGKAPTSKQTLFYLINLFGMLMFFLYLARAAKKIKSLSPLDITLGLAALIMIPAYLISNRPIDVYAVRYLVPVFIFGAIFIARNIEMNAKVSYLLTAVFIIAAAGSWRAEPLRNNPDEIINQLKDAIRNNHLQRGYASFWYASSVSIDGDISIAPIEIDQNTHKISASRWLSDARWYTRGGDFFIADTPAMAELIKRHYGDPVRVIAVNEKSLLVYTRNIVID